MNHRNNDETRRAASELWHHEQTQRRLTQLHANRPAAFNQPGTLHPDITTWANHVAAGHYANLVIVGNVGVGKSWSLWAAAEHLIHHGWLGSAEILPGRRLRRLIAPPIDHQALDRLADANLLAIDDVGSVAVSEWDSDHISAMVDARWEHQRPSILTSNHLDLRDLIGERAASRLADHAVIVQMTGPDRRRTA